MFTVAIRALADASQEIQLIVRKLNQQIQELEDIISSIRRTSVYEGVVRNLRVQLENLNQERRRMMDMLAALNQIQKMYLQSERSIIDYGDQVRNVNYYRRMDVVNLTEIRDTIRRYQIR